MATIEIRSVGTSSRDYSTLQSAWNDIATIAGSTNLVSEDVQVIFEVYDDSTFTERVSFSGLTTDATRNVIIRKASTSGRPTWQPSSGTGHVFTIQEDFCIFEELNIFQYSGAGTSDECVRVGSSTASALGTTFKQCYILGDRAISQLDCIYAGNWDVGSATYPIRLENCQIREAQRALVHAQHFSGVGNQYWEIINCTLSGCIGDGFGWRANDASTTIFVVYKNNITIRCSDAFDSTAAGSGSVDTTGSSNNFDQDGTSPGPGTPNPILITDSTSPGAGSFAIFVAIETNAEDDDLHLVDSINNDVIGGGVGPGADADVPGVDLDGYTRSGLVCEPGCFEIPNAEITSFNSLFSFAGF